MAVQEIDLGNVQGPKGDPGPQGPQGKQGPEGPQGPPGEFNMEAGLTFSEASTRTNINSGESLKTILGKIKKFFTDLKPHAFTDPVNNLTGTDPRFPLAAPQGKALDQKIAQLNSALTVRISDSEYSTNESMYDAPIYARAYNIGLPNVPDGNTETIEIELPDAHSAWIDTANSYIYSSYSAYPLTYIDHTMTNLISAYLDFRAKKIIIQIKGNWEGFTAWIIVKHYSYS